MIPTLSVPLAAAVADRAGVLLYRCAADCYASGEAAVQWLNAARCEA
jgi:hypothetical protein